VSADAATVHVTVPAADVEVASDVLWGAGAAAIEERAASAPAGDRAVVVLVAGTRTGGDVDGLVAAVGGRWPAEVVPVDLGAALDGWRAHARPVRVGPLVVRPPWVPGPARAPGDGAVEIVIDPGRAFGSGAHPSTRLALAALADLVRGGEQVLDVGCGSGVLAVAALRLGAAGAVGLDTDPRAVAASRANAARNGVADRFAVAAGDAGAGPAPVGRASCDVVVANMLLPELVAAVRTVAAAVRPAGAVVLSGVLDEQVDAVSAASAAGGLRVDGRPRREEGWSALVLRRGGVRPPRPSGGGQDAPGEG
jgi:ribosomal protein L11 methyltransferase